MNLLARHTFQLQDVGDITRVKALTPDGHGITEYNAECTRSNCFRHFYAEGDLLCIMFAKTIFAFWGKALVPQNDPIY